MTDASKAQSVETMPSWAWPVLGLVGGLALVFVVHGTCLADPKCK